MALITAQLHMLEHMSPVDYAVVRTALGHGAGFDSPGFRGVHHVSPILGEAFDALLTRRGTSLLAVYQAGHAHENLDQLAEQMVTWDERVILWRVPHLQGVEGSICGPPLGTPGGPGGGVCERIHDRFLPVLL